MGDEYDDDDFEDYDGDEFEDEDEAHDAAAVAAKAAAAQQAQATEQRRALLARQEQQALRDRPPPQPPNINRGPLASSQAPPVRPAMAQKEVPLSPSAPQRRFIAPPSNEARQVKEQRAARLKALRSVLQLRAVDVTLYDAAPLTPYELHTRHQSGKLRAKMCQTGDDDISIGIQTEEIETDVASCQWPEDGTAPGMSAASSGLEASDSAKTTSNLTANIGRLGRFLSSAGLVVETLCTENLLAASGAADAVQQPNALPFSSRHTRLNLPAALGDRSPHHLTFDAAGGTEEGSVQLWNLREAGSSHPSVEIGAGDRISLRSPTYASDCLAGGPHTSPIAALAPLPISNESDDLSIASLDCEGTLMIWLVLEAVDLDALDLGQAVGGKERLLRSGSISVASTSAGGQLRLRASGGNGAAGGTSVLPTVCVSMAFLPADPSRLLVATDQPDVLGRSRYSEMPPSPEAYSAHGSSKAGGKASGVSALAFHPGFPAHFLAGRTDGSVALYHVDDPLELLVWEGHCRGGVVALTWSPSRPSIFWVLDGEDTMHLFDLLADAPTPITSSTVHTQPGATAGGDGQANDEASARLESSRRMCFALDAPSGASNVRVGHAAASRLAAITSRSAGRLSAVEVHVLADAYGTPQPDESTRVAHVLGKL